MSCVWQIFPVPWWWRWSWNLWTMIHDCCIVLVVNHTPYCSVDAHSNHPMLW
jgi:hypothetical protein